MNDWCDNKFEDKNEFDMKNNNCYDHKCENKNVCCFKLDFLCLRKGSCQRIF